MAFLKQDIKYDIIIYLVFAVVTAYLTYVSVSSFGYQEKFTNLWYSLYRPVWLVFIVSIFQEVIFRGWLMPFLKAKYKKAIVVIFLNALIYASVHVIFPYWEFLLPGSFLLGLAYAAIYYYRPNLILITLSHILLNILVVPFCLFGCG